MVDEGFDLFVLVVLARDGNVGVMTISGPDATEE